MITIKKILYLIPITILFIFLSINFNVYAYTGTIIIFGDPYRSACHCVQYDGNPILVSENDSIKILDGDSRYIGSANYPYGVESLDGYINYLNYNAVTFGYGGVHNGYVSIPCNTEVIYVYTGYIINNSDVSDDIIYNPNVPAPPEPDTWYEILWNQFTDWIDLIGDSLSDGYEDFINWIKGESTHGGGHSFELPDMVGPSPDPTPIPYNTVIVPKTDPDTGDTYYEFNYVYNNPSGTPIITGQPPDITVNDNDFEYPYYDNPDNKNNPYYFEIPWYLKFINGNNVFDLDDMGDNLTVIENAVNDETISDGVDTAYSSMGVLPSSWVQLIGIIAAIPLIGALIARFLKG